MAYKNLICRSWTFFRLEKSKQLSDRAIEADSNHTWYVVHGGEFFYFFQFFTYKAEFALARKSSEALWSNRNDFLLSFNFALGLPGLEYETKPNFG